MGLVRKKKLGFFLRTRQTTQPRIGMNNKVFTYDGDNMELRYVGFALRMITAFHIARVMLEEWDRIIPIFTAVGAHTLGMFK